MRLIMHQVAGFRVLSQWASPSLVGSLKNPCCLPVLEPGSCRLGSGLQTALGAERAASRHKVPKITRAGQPADNQSDLGTPVTHSLTQGALEVCSASPREGKGGCRGTRHRHPRLACLSRQGHQEAAAPHGAGAGRGAHITRVRLRGAPCSR